MNETIHIHDEAPAYALHALTPADTAAVEGHAAQCAPCQKALDEALETAQMLGFTVASQAPPARCKAKLLERIERESFLTRPSRRSSTRPRLNAWGPVAMAALTLLVLWNMRMQSEVQAVRAQATTAEQGYIALQATIEQNRAMQAVLVASEANHPLEPRGPHASKAKAKMYMTPGDNMGVIVIKDLPPPPAGKVYRVWVADDGAQWPCSTITTGGEVVDAMVKAPKALDSYRWIMVTVEDAQGSEHPSDQTVLIGNF